MDFAVDSNCICGLQCERIDAMNGPFSAAIAKLFGLGRMLLDGDGHCQQEWLDTAAGPVGLNLGSGLVDQSQKMTVAARAMAERKTVGHRS